MLSDNKHKTVALSLLCALPNATASDLKVNQTSTVPPFPVKNERLGFVGGSCTHLRN
jgi:hypothetical protein